MRRTQMNGQENDFMYPCTFLHKKTLIILFYLEIILLCDLIFWQGICTKIFIVNVKDLHRKNHSFVQFKLHMKSVRLQPHLLFILLQLLWLLELRTEAKIDIPRYDL